MSILSTFPVGPGLGISLQSSNRDEMDLACKSLSAMRDWSAKQRESLWPRIILFNTSCPRSSSLQAIDDAFRKDNPGIVPTQEGRPADEPAVKSFYWRPSHIVLTTAPDMYGRLRDRGIKKIKFFKLLTSFTTATGQPC